jgi:hypothetical protein
MGREPESSRATTHADAVHYDIGASRDRSTHCCGTIWPGYGRASWPGTAGADYALGADHGICVGSIVSHARSERGDGYGESTRLSLWNRSANRVAPSSALLDYAGTAPADIVRGSNPLIVVLPSRRTGGRTSREILPKGARPLTAPSGAAWRE